MLRSVDVVPRAKALLRPYVWQARRRTLGRAKIRRHLQSAARSGQPVRVVLGGHWCEPAGWLVLDERDQDVTEPLAFPDGSVDAVFCEHVIEHVSLAETLALFVEVHRILRPGGVFRVVVPTIEAMIAADLTTDQGRSYMRRTIAHHFRTEEALVRERTGESLVATAPNALFVNFMFYEHGHRFIWTTDLLVHALRWAGFADVRQREVGEGADADVCLERRRRGDYVGFDPDEDKAGVPFNVDSGIAEAVR